MLLNSLYCTGQPLTTNTWLKMLVAPKLRSPRQFLRLHSHLYCTGLLSHHFELLLPRWSFNLPSSLHLPTLHLFPQPSLNMALPYLQDEVQMPIVTCLSPLWPHLSSPIYCHSLSSYDSTMWISHSIHACPAHSLCSLISCFLVSLPAGNTLPFLALLTTISPLRLRLGTHSFSLLWWTNMWSYS